MPCNHLILCCPLLLPSVFPSIRVFSSELALTSGSQSIGASLVAQMVKKKKNLLAMQETICNARRLTFNPWVRKIPWRREWQPLQYSCLENRMDREAWLKPGCSLGYSWWGRKEYCSGLPFPPPGDLLNPRIETMSPVATALAGSLYHWHHPGSLQ